ncbi:hypothetical protein BCR37DRAFT_394847 [Protomyces lactucae-debilis]|uniref:Uncharacterized protein n=1 Tax=Protomyces lactucae-debilis TaxID=2754530 RepID=A0A1Y2F1L8_PROLT|nr:uncharacterized protein BCR37DRAFT_394847 [Protomyces lactucae-debilis]ORY77759.1 hypothetical protein BCR37DRAFT_394847 [Protomyces lactucae-debilis]
MDDLRSILPVAQVPVSQLPQTGQKAPAFPHTLTGSPSLIVFLRHCGCPFSEVAFRSLDKVVGQYSNKINCYAISHATAEETQVWIDSLNLAHGKQIKIVIDTSRELYGQWGLGQTSLLHWLGYNSLSSVWTLATQQGIRNRTTKGTRWQQSGQFATDATGKLVFCQAAGTANEVADLKELANRLVGSTTEAKL